MFRNWILQDLPHVFQQKSLQQTVKNFHTSTTKNRKFWNVFDCSRKNDDNNNNNFKDIENLSKSTKNNDTPPLRSTSELNDETKNMIEVMSKQIINNSNKVYSSKFINKQHTLFDDDDNNNISNNTKYNKSRTYKCCKNNLQSKHLDFLSANKSFHLNIKTGQIMKKIPNNNNNNNLSTKLQGTKSKSNVLPIQSKIIKIKSSIKMNDDTSNNSIINKNQNETKIMSNISYKIPLKIKYNNISSNVFNRKYKHNQETTLKNTKEIKSNQSPSNSLNYIQNNNNNNTNNNNEKSYFISTLLNNNNNNNNQDKNINNNNNSQQFDTTLSVVKNVTDYNLKKLETNLRRSSKINNKSKNRNNRKRMTNSLPCTSIKFAKSPDDNDYYYYYSTNQRWPNSLDLTTVKGCCSSSVRNSNRNNGSTTTKGSTRPYQPPIVQTREISSSLDPIVRSNILSFHSDMFKRRKSISCVNLSFNRSTTNLNNSNVYSRIIQSKRILLGSNYKLSSGIKKNNQRQSYYFYGSCNKSKKPTNDDSCCKKRKSECDDDTQLIPGKVICIDPKKKDCCKPKKRCCRRKKKSCCTKKPPIPPPQIQRSSSCCKSKPKKKKICKRYCCPALQSEDCVIKQGICPTKRRSKCEQDLKVDDNNEKLSKTDPTCLPMEKTKSQIEDDDDCNNNNNNKYDDDECCNSSIKKCSNDRNEKYNDCFDDNNDSCDMFNKSKRNDCSNNTRRNSRRSNSFNRRRYHSITRSLSNRKTKSSINIPIFDVSVVSLRPYQNDSVLRFYSNRSSSCKDDYCQKQMKSTSCKKPSGPPKCLNDKSKKDICDKTKKDPCGFEQSRSNVCEKSQIDICQSTKGKDKHDERMERELREMRECKGKNKSICNDVTTGKSKIIDPCKKNSKYDKLESNKSTMLTDLLFLN